MPTSVGRPLFLLRDDVVDDRAPLLGFGAIDEIGLLDSDQRPVGRNHHHVEVVDLGELGGLGLGRAGHARQLLVLAEVVLEGDGGERLILALDLDAFLGFDGLVQPVAPPASGHQPTRELVHDDDAAVFDHVLHVQVVMDVSPEPLLHVVEQGHVGRIVEAARLQPMRQQLLGLRHAALGERRRLVLLVDDVVAGCLEPIAILALDLALVNLAALQLGDDAIDFVVQVGGLFGRAGNDQRSPGLVDEDAVDFVDDREVVPALHHGAEVELHVVAEIVEAELVVGAVGDVAGVGDLPLLIVQLVLNDADAHAEEAVQAPHPFRVAAGQVVVDGDHVDALALERVQIGGQGGDQRLAFTGLHLGDGAAVQRHAADQLDVVVTHVQHAAAGFADHREHLGQQVVDRSRPCRPGPGIRPSSGAARRR